MAGKQWSSPPAMDIDPQKTYRAVMETSRGTIELELYAQFAPKTVNTSYFWPVRASTMVSRFIGLFVTS